MKGIIFNLLEGFISFHFAGDDQIGDDQSLFLNFIS